MKAFFSMRRGEAVALLFLIAFSAFSFLPVWRRVALMLISPVLTLFVFLRGERED